jgi:hypothetical protein
MLCKESAVVKFQEQFRHLPTGSDKNHEKLEQAIARIQVTRITTNNVSSHLYHAMNMNIINSQVITKGIYGF